MSYKLPKYVKIDGQEYHIRNDCDYELALDVFEALHDTDLEPEYRVLCAFKLFYEEFENIPDTNYAVQEMYRILSIENESENKNPDVVDWKRDFHLIAPAVSRVLGYDVRDPNKYTHWWTFIGAFMEIGDCFYTNVLSIRTKLAKGEQLEKSEKKFYYANKKTIDLPLSKEDSEWLFGED